MNRKELLEELTADIFTYVMQGGFPQEKLSEKLKPESLDERFEEYEHLMDLHFILKEEVVEFVEKLPRRLRRIKTQTKNVSKTKRGNIDGRINWSSTIQKRYSRNPGDRSLFVCENRTEDYDIDENIVLKKILSIIYHSIKNSEEYLKEEYDWVTERWRDEKELVDEMKNIFEKNVHVKRIKKPEKYEPTERMVHTAIMSRDRLYRDSAELFRKREKIQNGDKTEIREMLENTMIAPDDQNRLLELYVLFRYIATIQDIMEGTPRIKTISKNRQEIARIEGEKRITLYHDSSGPDSLRFMFDREHDGEEGRLTEIHEKTKNLLSEYFKINRNDVTGRPDVIVLEIKEENDYEYLITEVKNSTNRETVRQGIKETLEYLAFMKLDERPVYSTDNPFGEGYNGLLVVQDMEEETKDITDQKRPLKIVQASELSSEDSEENENTLRKLLQDMIIR